MCTALLVILAILNVFFRDVAPLTNIVLQFGFWLTPIVYGLEMIPQRYRALAALNPLAAIFNGYHQIFVDGQFPNWLSLGPAIVLSFVLTLVAAYLFIKRSAEMVDEL